MTIIGLKITFFAIINPKPDYIWYTFITFPEKNFPGTPLGYLGSPSKIDSVKYSLWLVKKLKKFLGAVIVMTTFHDEKILCIIATLDFDSEFSAAKMILFQTMWMVKNCKTGHAWSSSGGLLWPRPEMLSALDDQCPIVRGHSDPDLDRNSLLWFVPKLSQSPCCNYFLSY